MREDMVGVTVIVGAIAALVNIAGTQFVIA